MKWVCIFIIGCFISFIDYSDKVEVANFSNINSSVDDFAPYLKDGKLYFVVKGRDAEHNTKVINLDIETKAKSLKNINNASHTSIAFHPSGNAFFTREVKPKNSIIKNHSIYFFNSEYELNALPFNSNSYSVTNPTFSNNGKYIIFQSNMDTKEVTNKGGYDLFISEITYDQSKNPARLYFSEPINIGKEVNSDADESHPFFHDDMLYFSRKNNSRDIYQVPFNINSSGTMEIGEATKMKSPINSKYDDFGYCTDGKKSFLVSNRADGKGGLDIYEVK